MQVYSKGIRAILDDIDAASKALQNAEARQSFINNIGLNQNRITLTINSSAFTLTEMDRYYKHVTRRGYEMVVLGLQKITSAEVDKCKAELTRLVIKLKEFTNEQSTTSI